MTDISNQLQQTFTNPPLAIHTTEKPPRHKLYIKKIQTLYNFLLKFTIFVIVTVRNRTKLPITSSNHRFIQLHNNHITQIINN